MKHKILTILGGLALLLTAACSGGDCTVVVPEPETPRVCVVLPEGTDAAPEDVLALIEADFPDAEVVLCQNCDDGCDIVIVPYGDDTEEPVADPADDADTVARSCRQKIRDRIERWRAWKRERIEEWRDRRRTR